MLKVGNEKQRTSLLTSITLSFIFPSQLLQEIVIVTLCPWCSRVEIYRNDAFLNFLARSSAIWLLLGHKLRQLCSHVQSPGHWNFSLFNIIRCKIDGLSFKYNLVVDARPRVWVHQLVVCFTYLRKSSKCPKIEKWK